MGHLDFKRIGDFEIQEILGEGACAVVYLAWQEKLRRRVALKVLRFEDPLFRKRFAREARLAAALAHPGIVRVHAVGEHEGHCWIAMEHVEGKTLLAEIQARGRLPEEEAASVLCQVARGLGAAHAKGIVHRDVKPANILVTARGVAKLSDLGLARALGADKESLTRRGALLGTLPYMSPEQIADASSADARADIYSLGASLFHTLTGQFPFTAASVASLVTMHVSAPRPDPREIVPGIGQGVAEIC